MTTETPRNDPAAEAFRAALPRYEMGSDFLEAETLLRRQAVAMRKDPAHDIARIHLAEIKRRADLALRDLRAGRTLDPADLGEMEHALCQLRRAAGLLELAADTA